MLRELNETEMEMVSGGYFGWEEEDDKPDDGRPPIDDDGPAQEELERRNEEAFEDFFNVPYTCETDNSTGGMECWPNTESS